MRAALLLIALAVLVSANAAGADPIDGSSAACTDFRLVVIPYVIESDVTDEGWVWVQRGNAGLPRFQSVSGAVTKSKIASNDTPSNHNSHDQDFDVLVDPGFAGLLSNVNGPNTGNRDNVEVDNGPDDLRPPTKLGVEWETGTFPSEKGQFVPERYFPRWAWPSVGDRVWANGHWVFDCGHGKEVGIEVLVPGSPPTILFFGEEYFRSEIHPPRAVASMRRQADVLPGTGTTRVPVTATDLYIHGEAGFVTDILNCGMSIIVDGVAPSGDPDACPTKTTPIAEDFEFDICLPPRPSLGARLAWRVEAGPANSVGGHAPQVSPIAAPPGCANDDAGDSIPSGDALESYDLVTALRVRIPLAGSGVADVETYSRKIVAGWVHPPASPLPHLRLTLDRVNTHVSGDGGVLASDDGELTFFYVNVDRAPNEWIRVADHAPVASNGNSVLNDVDPSLFGNSFIDLDGAAFDFYVPAGDDVGIAARVYDQDCYENDFGDHTLSIGTYAGCAVDIDETGGSDDLDRLDVRLGPPTFDGPAELGSCPGVGPVGSASCNVTTVWKPRIFSVSPPTVVPRPDYELDFTLERLALGDEDRADLSVAKGCRHEGDLLLVGQPLSCTITVRNQGPGLPRGVLVTDTISGTLAPSEYAIGVPTLQVGDGPVTTPCTVSANGFSCPIETIPVGEAATIDVSIVLATVGTITNGARAATASEDAQGANDEASVTEAVYCATRTVYTGVTTADYHDPATVSAILDCVGNPLAGKGIVFTLGGVDTCSAQTDPSGTATCILVPTRRPASYDLVASFAEPQSLYLPSSDTETFVVTKEQTRLTFEGAGAAFRGRPVALRAKLVEDDGRPVDAGRPVRFQLGTQSCVGVTDATGGARCTIVVNQTAGTKWLSLGFAGDPFYLPSAASASVVVR